MGIIWTVIRFILISILSIFYWPLNVLFTLLKKHYFIWKKEDKLSFYLATPFYYLLLIITATISTIFGNLAEAAHPGLDGFK